MPKRSGYSFFLKRPLSDQPTSIFLKTSFNGKPFKYGIGKSIYPELWDKNSQTPTQSRQLIRKYEKNSPQIGIELSNIESRLRNVERTIQLALNNQELANEAIDITLLKQQLDATYKETFQSEQKVEHPFFLEFLKAFINDIESGRRVIDHGRRKGQRYSTGTVVAYKGTKKQWTDFEKNQGKRFRFDHITVDLYDDLVQFFNGQNMQPNTIGKHIKNIKVIMRISREKGLHNNNDYEKKRFQKVTANTVDVYLTENELKSLETLKLKKNSPMERSRDVFLCGCYTALRYSDYSRIQPEHVKGDVLDIITRKEKDRVVIPIKPALSRILEKYNNKLPRTYEQKVNGHLKDLAKLAKINDVIEVEKIMGGVRATENVPKYKLIKTHTARRTGATLMYLAGIAPTDIMKITGHKTEASFRRYIKVSKEETAARVAQHPYFRQPQTLKKVE